MGKKTGELVRTAYNTYLDDIREAFNTEFGKRPNRNQLKFVKSVAVLDLHEARKHEPTVTAMDALAYALTRCIEGLRHNRLPAPVDPEMPESALRGVKKSRLRSTGGITRFSIPTGDPAYRMHYRIDPDGRIDRIQRKPVTRIVPFWRESGKKK